MAKLINLTPYNINLYDEEHKTILEVIPTLGAAKIRVVQNPIKKVNGYALFKLVMKEVQGLPPPAHDTFYIVTRFVLQYMAGKRSDLITPNTTLGAVRSGSGKLLGVTGFITI